MSGDGAHVEAHGDARRERLDAAYRRSTYRATIDGQTVELRIGAPGPVLDALLAGRGCAGWAWLTAVNPASRQLTDTDNARRLQALGERLRRGGWPHWPASAAADAGDWPPEEGFLVAGIALPDAVALAADFGQNAFVAASSGNPAQLLWIDDLTIAGGRVADDETKG